MIKSFDDLHVALPKSIDVVPDTITKLKETKVIIILLYRIILILFQEMQHHLLINKTILKSDDFF